MIKGEPLTTIEKRAQAGQRVVQGGALQEYLYVPANTEKGEVLVKAYDGDEESNPKAVAAATSAFKVKIAVASEDQGTTAGFQWCTVEGPCEALVDGTTDVAKDDFLEVLNGADGFIKDGTARAATSAAIAREAQAANEDTLTLVYLLGEGNTISAT